VSGGNGDTGMTGAGHGRATAGTARETAGTPEATAGGATRAHVLTLRVPKDLLRRLDAYTTQMQATQPYQRLSRADVIRMLLDQGLPAAR
jgi:hypothetical protein